MRGGKLESYSWSYAPTGRARCNGACKRPIAKGSIRFSNSKAGSLMATYRCLDCVTQKQISNVEKVGGASAVRGWDALRRASQVKIRRRFAVRKRSAGDGVGGG